MPKVSSKLCGLCINIPVRWLLKSPSRGYLLFRHDTELSESAERCDLCHLILRSIGNLKNGMQTVSITMSPQFLIVEVFGSSGVDYRVLRLCTDPGSKATSIGVEVSLPALPEAGSELHFHILNEWLRDCNESHNSHKSASQEKELPTRVLEVRSDLLRLRENDKTTYGKYIALSHRWGEDNHKKRLITSNGNKGDHCKSINFDCLPKTFQHAVTVTRNLGIQYLWIDSLCIIQDDEEDWKRESNRMESVFANAYCTIAATSSEDSWAGFLDRPSVGPSVKLVDGSADPPFHVYANEVGGSFDSDLKNGELNRRAWVLQERALSPRTIHFTSGYTYWECGSVVRCENLIQMVKPSDLLSSSQFPMTVSGPPPGGAASAFEDIFTRYSRLNIAFTKDRPYAIAGLQNRLENQYQTKATYGIIHCCIQRSLLWQRAGKWMEDDPGTGMIPSWSWMKYRGEIRYGKFPTTNVRWNRDIKFTPTDGSNDQVQLILEAPVVRISQNCRIETWRNTGYGYRIENAGGCLAGWIKFDGKDKVDVGGLGCIWVMRQNSDGWTEIGQDSWKGFADVSCPESLDLNGLSYILLVSSPARKQGYEMEVCRRLGVAVIQANCLLSGGQPRTVRLI
ncbi:heterokaryon incompatibility protein-domain-containing protein [Xylariaceae sp. AK1471]|nr:heterokaryon incompatibility protein-domain-containing protein [Xylariaceae sp. AK1471]